jgi:hypothetical protein
MTGMIDDRSDPGKHLFMAIGISTAKFSHG